MLLQASTEALPTNAEGAEEVPNELQTRLER